MNSFPMSLLTLTLWWRGRLSYRNQSIDLLRKSMDWFLCDNSLRHERVKKVCFLCLFNADFKHTLALLSAWHSLALLSASHLLAFLLASHTLALLPASHWTLKYPEIKSIQSSMKMAKCCLCFLATFGKTNFISHSFIIEFDQDFYCGFDDKI